MKTLKVVRRTLGLVFGIQLLVGLALWVGLLAPLVQAHRAIGLLYVLLLWTLAALALARRRAIALAAVTVVLGFFIAGLGFGQPRLLIGEYHWIVRVIHLALGLAGMLTAAAIEARLTTADQA
ncbi:MAG: hypothetical protein ABJB74_03215 [Gemmatimonas sp.]